MPSLTPQLLDHFSYFQYADTQTVQRGHAYYKEDRVWDVNLFNNNSKAVCEVEGNSGDYTVEAEWTRNRVNSASTATVPTPKIIFASTWSPPRTERIVYTDMDAAQKKLYTQTREKYRAELLGLIESDGMNDARFKILEGLLRLRQIAIHPALVDKNYKGEAPKFEILLETLETLQAENHKALIFSQFVETLKLVKRELDERKIKYMYLDGKTPNRQAKVGEFQNNDSVPFFLISLKAGGVGLNLTAADYVIHLDPWWNPAVEMQASDRAHRIGQDKPVFVYKIIARDTVEKILQLQKKKRALVKSIISNEDSFFKSLTKDDVKALFS